MTLQNFQYLSITLVLCGWLFLYYLNNRAFKRGEVARFKDRLVDRLSATNDWLLKEWFLNEKNYSGFMLEELLTSKITHIELRMEQYNNFIGYSLIDTKCLSNLRDFDVGAKRDEVAAIIFSESVSDIIEHIEETFSIYLHRKSPIKIWNTKKYEIVGALCGMVIVSTFFLAAYCSSK
ncbi:hypothetical protein A9Q79_10270 [Methylophaga sp. 42_25_T18]|nr:hypothetical protein A9Q79_10270 [Methylophaga sp. 42_25_T18]